MEHTPQPVAGAHWTRPARQMVDPAVTKRMEIERLPPVFGTAQPPKGLSGLLRRKAYATSETLVRHWMLLLLADRVDIVESRFGKLSRRGAVAAGAAVAVFAAIRALKTLQA